MGILCLNLNNQRESINYRKMTNSFNMTNPTNDLKTTTLGKLISVFFSDRALAPDLKQLKLALFFIYAIPVLMIFGASGIVLMITYQAVFNLLVNTTWQPSRPVLVTP